MKSNELFLDQIERYLSQLEIPLEPERLYSPIGYSLSAGGKRIRPMLVMLGCALFSDKTSVALPAAAAVEVFHNFTLLHDDIMDNAMVRRGKPSVHAKWDKNVAILSGDVMLIHAYKLLTELPSEKQPEILKIFNTMAAQVCEGQQYDMDFESRAKVSVVDYMRMIELKTSVLLGCAATIGAILGGATPEQCQTINRFATEIGLAFQLQDDLLDSYGDEQLGKSIGGDILEGKQTYLMVSSMSRADEPTRDILRTTYRDESLSDSEKIARVKEVYNSLGVEQLIQQQIKSRFDRAFSMLDTLNIEAERAEALRSFVSTLINRQK